MPSETQPSQTNKQLSELIKECLARIEEYKVGLHLPLKKVQSITKVTKILLRVHITPSLTESKINAPLLTYIAIINAADVVIQQVEHIGYDGRNLKQVERESVGVALRERSDTPDKRQFLKMQKVNVDTFPWVQQEIILVTSLNTNLTAMLTLLKLYIQDLKLTKSSVLTSSCVPQLSHLEWLRVLTGVMVNLDHVLSGMHTISNDN